MTTPIWKLRKIVDRLQCIIDEAEAREVDDIMTRANTYGLSSPSFISLGYDGFLDLDADIDELLGDSPERDDNDDVDMY